MISKTGGEGSVFLLKYRPLLYIFTHKYTGTIIPLIPCLP